MSESEPERSWGRLSEPAGPLPAAARQSAQVPTALALPVQGPVALPGRSQDSFPSRLNQLRAQHSQAASWSVLAMYAAVVLRWWRLSTPATAAWMLVLLPLAATNLVWQAVQPASHASWREVPAALLILAGSGLGLGWLQTCIMLNNLQVPSLIVTAGTQASSGGPLAALSAVRALWGHTVLLLFVSGALGMLLLSLSLRMRLSLSAAVQVAVALSAWPYNPCLCASAPLAHPAASALTHRIYSVLSHLSLGVTLPLGLFAQHDAAAECVTVITFLQLGLGTLVPLLMHAVSEARLFQHHQKQRWQAGLPLLRGAQAAAYDSIWWGSLGGSGPHTCLAGGLLLAACWDWCAFFCASPSPTQ